MGLRRSPTAKIIGVDDRATAIAGGQENTSLQSIVEGLNNRDRYFTRPILGVFDSNFPNTSGDRYINKSDPTQIVVVGGSPEPFPEGAVAEVSGSDFQYKRVGNSLILRDAAREKLEANTTFYIATTGSNSSARDGRTQSEPWRSLQYAFNRLASDYDLNSVTVTLQIEDGIYSQNSLIFPKFIASNRNFACTFIFRGNPDNPENVVLDFTSSPSSSLFNIRDLSGLRICIGGFTIRANNPNAIALNLLRVSGLEISFPIIFEGNSRIDLNCSNTDLTINSGITLKSGTRSLNCIRQDRSNIVLNQDITIPAGENITCQESFFSGFNQSLFIARRFVDNQGQVFGRRFLFRNSAIDFSGITPDPNYFPGDLPGIYRRELISDPVSWIPGALLTFPHGWENFDPGTEPYWVGVWAICLVPEYGYPVGSRVQLNYGASHEIDSSNIYVSPTISGPLVSRRDGGSLSKGEISETNWDIYVIAGSKRG